MKFLFCLGLIFGLFSYLKLKSIDDVKIIKLDPNDWLLYRDLRINAVQESPQAFGTSYEEELATSDADWKRRLGLNMLFAVKNGKLVGMVGAVIESRERLRHIAKVISMYVVPEERGKKVGTLLLSHLLEDLKNFECLKKITLQVTLEQIPAIRLYKKLGFHVSGVLEDEYYFGNRFYDQLIMTKDVESSNVPRACY